MDDQEGVNELIDSPWLIEWEDDERREAEDTDDEPDAAYQLAAYDREDQGRP